MSIADAYQSMIDDGDLEEDDAQGHIVERMAALQAELQAARTWSARTWSARIRRLLPGTGGNGQPKGMYLWGGVGRGKTFLMDLFFSTLAIDDKRRIHFHRMMRDVHRRLGRIENAEDPLDIVAADIAGEVDVLCFDEFFVSDIGDAMILGRLLEGLFARGVTLVATSNSPPRDLYKNGLQRQRFIPAIEALERHTEVVELGGSVDYRLQLFQETGTYLVPAGDDADRKLSRYFDGIASGDTRHAQEIDVLGRRIHARRSAKGIAWFEFDDLCDGPRSQEDYIELARWYPTVIVSGIPVLDARRENQARRFIALVDEFYDRRVKLVVSAAAGVDSLYRGRQLSFEFERTASRLTEMQTEDYLHAPHLA